MAPTQPPVIQSTAAATGRLPGAWLVVALLALVGCLNYLDRIMITTMRSSIVDAMPMTDAQFGLLTSVFLWVYGLLSPFAGFLADRFNRSRVIIASLFVWSVMTCLTAQARTFEELLATRALMGISEAAYIPAALALIADYHPGATRSLATGLHMAGIMVGQGLGFVGGWLAEWRDWTLAFSVFGGIGMGYALVLASVLRDAPRLGKDHLGKDRPGEDRPGVHPAASMALPTVRFGVALRDLFRRKDYRRALLCWGLLGVVSWLIVGWLPTYYKEQFGLSQRVAGLYATGYFYGAALLGVLLGGAWADRWSQSNPRARMVVPALGLCVAAPAILVASHTTVLAVAVGGFVTYALTRPFVDANMMPILCVVTDPRYRATGYGVLNLFSCVVGGAGIYAGGLLRDTHVNLGGLFQTAAVGLLVCAGLLARLRPKPEPLT